MLYVNNPQIDDNATTITTNLSTKVKIRKGITVNPKPLEEFKKELIEQATNPQNDNNLEIQEKDASLETEISKNKDGESKTDDQVDSEIQEKIKLGNNVSEVATSEIDIEEVITEPLNSAFYVVQYSGLGIEELNNKLTELQKINADVPDKEEQIKAINQLITENIEAAKKVNGE